MNAVAEATPTMDARINVANGLVTLRRLDELSLSHSPLISVPPELVIPESLGGLEYRILRARIGVSKLVPLWRNSRSAWVTHRESFSLSCIYAPGESSGWPSRS